MLRRPLHAWIIFTVCLLIGAGVMGWITRAALQLAKTEGEARNNAALEENVRLALWRMESALAPLIAQESARPYYLYSQYYSGYYHGKDGAGKVRIPSPLALQNPPFTLLHFQIAPSGQITSPQIANGSARPDGPETERTCRRSQQELLHLQSILKYPTLLERLEEVENAMPIPTPTAEGLEDAPPDPMEHAPAPAAAPLPASSGAAGVVALTEQAKGGLNSDKNGDMVGSVSSPTTDFFAQGNAADRNAPAPIVQADMKKEKIAPASAAAEPQKPLSSNTSSKSSSSSSRAQSDMRSLGTAISELGAGQSANTAASQQSASGLKQLLAQQEGNGTNQQAKSINEYQMRQISMSNMNTVAQSGAQVQNATMPVSVEKDSLKSDTESPDVREGGMRAFWSGDSLLLVRRVTLGNQTYLQGCSLDWPEVRKCLLNSIRDLLPQASLLPMESTPAQNGSRLLAALPVRLQPGHLPSQVSTPTLHPIQFALIITWVGLGVAAIAVALLLAGILSLSERRATFVSAVTHELRTPLTTLRMYSEMLSEGRVRSEEKIAHYHRTINTEAGRLAHLVENVLSYARLERGHPGNRAETADLPCFLERIGERLVDRAHQVGMELSIEMTPVAQTAAIHANLSSVEQILFNLVDNTCKYAVSADDKRICLNVDASEYVATLSVRDFGPGIDAKESRRLFRAFHKSAHDAAHSAPGVGLGLALSRRLARAMRGDLRHDASTQPGACFILTLPRVPR